MKKKLYRAKQGKKLLGVCQGVANYFDIDSTIVRIIWVLLALGWGAGILAYVICALVMPEEPDYIEAE